MHPKLYFEIRDLQKATQRKMPSRIWRNTRNNTENIRRRKGKVNWGKSEGETNHERLCTLRNKQGFRGFWVSLVVGIMEGTYCMEH